MSINSKSPFKETPYFTAENYVEFAELLEIPVSAFEKKIVGIMDTNEEYDFRIALFHYHPELVKRLHEPSFGFNPLEIQAIQQIRGIVVDVDAMRKLEDPSRSIACRSAALTSNCIRNSVPADGSFTFDNRFGECAYAQYSSENIYKEWIYGTLLRIFCYNNFTFISTHKKISCANSFFGSSRKFQDIFFSDQTVFSAPEDLFRTGERNGLIHLFILSDPDLIPDSSRGYDESRIYYICSYDLNNPENDETAIMTARIQAGNHRAEKQIHFPRVLSVEEVNETLSGTRRYAFEIDQSMNYEHASDSMSTLGKQCAVEMFKPADKVFMANDYGIFSVTPSSSVVRTLMMDGKAQVTKIFSDCISDLSNGTLNRSRLIVPYGFTYDQLLSMKDRIISGEPINFDEYDDIPVCDAEIILTNLVFFSPKHKVEECFTAFLEFSERVIQTANYLYSIKDELKAAIISKKLDEFPSLKTGSVQIKRYLMSDFCACTFTKPGKVGQKCINTIIGTGIKSHWSRRIANEFIRNEEEGKRTKNVSFLIKNAILCFVMNAPGDVLFGLLKFEEKVNKTKAAFAKRAAGAATSSPPMSDKDEI